VCVTLSRAQRVLCARRRRRRRRRRRVRARSVQRAPGMSVEEEALQYVDLYGALKPRGAAASRTHIRRRTLAR
jgi:hypothetical protein